MKILSRNVNGIRAVLQKGFFDWVKHNDPDILCIQETKAFVSQLPPEFKYAMRDYEMVWHAGQRPGYAGVATFVKKDIPLLSHTSHFGEVEHFHEDGRVVEIEFGNIVLLNVYFPNGGERADGTEMLSYKLAFYDKMIDYIDRKKAAGKQIIVCGDFNICHHAIDIARPEENKNSIGFLPVERAKMDELVSHGYVDVFRKIYPNLVDQYTWWSYRAGARPRNVGWRLDYFWVSENVVPMVQSVQHQTQVEGSDHCPILLSI